MFKKMLPIVLMLSSVAFAYEEIKVEIPIKALAKITPFKGHKLESRTGQKCQLNFSVYHGIIKFDNETIELSKHRSAGFETATEYILEVYYGQNRVRLIMPKNNTGKGSKVSFDDGKTYSSCIRD